MLLAVRVPDPVPELVGEREGVPEFEGVREGVLERLAVIEELRVGVPERVDV